MYKALREFTDLQDRGYVYHAGDIYPHKGYAPNDKRINELASKGNRLGTAVIAKYDEPSTAEITSAVEPEKKPRRRKPKK